MLLIRQLVIPSQRNKEKDPTYKTSLPQRVQNLRTNLIVENLNH